MNGSAGLPPVLVSLVLLMLGGCIPAGSGGALPAPGAPGGEGADVGGGGTGDAGTDDAGQTGGDETDGDAGGDGTGGDVGTDGEEDTGEGITPPTVNLFIADTTTTPGDLIFLNCSVADSGGGLVRAYSFTSLAGPDTITHDGVSATATAYVPIGLYSITYTCSATNEAGQGPPSNPVTVTVGGG